MTTELESAAFQRRARRAYELGRLRAAVRGALLLATAGALLGTLLVGPSAVVWAPLTFALWVWLSWRGGALVRGARYGALAGGLTFLLPLSLLRPCCRGDALRTMSMTSCTMPAMCVALGALVGLPLAAWALWSARAPEGALGPRREPRRLELGLGMWLGMVSVATFKCSALFLGEALGLLGGLALGMAMAGAVAARGAQRREA